MIYYSAEARGYALMMALRRCSRRWRCCSRSTTAGPLVGALRGCSCGAVYTHYTCVFVLAAQFVWVLGRTRRRAGRPDRERARGRRSTCPGSPGFVADLNSPTTEILERAAAVRPRHARSALGHWAVGYPVRRSPGCATCPATAAWCCSALARSWLGGAAVRPLRAPARRALPGLRPPASFSLLLALATPVGEALVEPRRHEPVRHPQPRGLLARPGAGRAARWSLAGPRRALVGRRAARRRLRHPRGEDARAPTSAGPTTATRPRSSTSRRARRRGDRRQRARSPGPAEPPRRRAAQTARDRPRWISPSSATTRSARRPGAPAATRSSRTRRRARPTAARIVVVTDRAAASAGAAADRSRCGATGCARAASDALPGKACLRACDRARRTSGSGFVAPGRRCGRRAGAAPGVRSTRPLDALRPRAEHAAARSPGTSPSWSTQRPRRRPRAAPPSSSASGISRSSPVSCGTRFIRSGQ